MKVFDYQIGDDLKICFAISGSVPHATKAIRLIVAALRKQIPHDDDGVISCVETVLQGYYNKWIWPHPYYQSASGSPDFRLIIGFRVGPCPLVLCGSEEEILIPAEHVFSGTGENLARYLIGPVYDRNADLHDAVVLSSSVLTQV